MNSSHTRRSTLALRATVAAASLTLLAACGAGGETPASGDSGSSGSGDTSAEVSTVGLLMDLPRNDGSFGQATAEGAAEAAEANDLELTVVDALEGKPSEARSALQNLARTNDLVIVVANAVIAELPQLAAQFPDTLFGVDADKVEGVENVYYAVQDWYPLGYLAGVAAATASETGTVGFVGGGLIPPTVRGQAGFEDGAADTNPDIEVLDTVTNSFTDPTAAKNATSAQLSSGADVIYSFLDAAHAGAVQAVDEAGGEARLIGVIAPKCDISQGYDLGDTVFAQAGSIANLIEMGVSGDVESRELLLEDPATQSLAFCEDADVPAEVVDAVTAARAAVNAGDVEIPAEGQE